MCSGTGVDTMWKRYRFKTKSVDDYRPLIFNPSYPWWSSGSGGGVWDAEKQEINFNLGAFVIIVAYLPEGEDLKNYWDDAYNITVEDCPEGPTFSDRFPKPDYYIEEVKIEYGD